VPEATESSVKALGIRARAGLRQGAALEVHHQPNLSAPLRRGRKETMRSEEQWEVVDWCDWCKMPLYEKGGEYRDECVCESFEEEEDEMDEH